MLRQASGLSGASVCMISSGQRALNQLPTHTVDSVVVGAGIYLCSKCDKMKLSHSLASESSSHPGVPGWDSVTQARG